VLALAAVVPDICVDIFELVRRQRHQEALALQRAITPLARLLGAVHGVAGLKYALDQIGYAGGPVRAPLGSLSTDAQKTIAHELAELARQTPSEAIPPTL
jgi:dihydrodipicolinate synthase/N-acetylneuraminate lyase